MMLPSDQADHRGSQPSKLKNVPIFKKKNTVLPYESECGHNTTTSVCVSSWLSHHNAIVTSSHGPASTHSCSSLSATAHSYGCSSDSSSGTSSHVFDSGSEVEDCSTDGTISGSSLLDVPLGPAWVSILRHLEHKDVGALRSSCKAMRYHCDQLVEGINVRRRDECMPLCASVQKSVQGDGGWGERGRGGGGATWEDSHAYLCFFGSRQPIAAVCSLLNGCMPCGCTHPALSLHYFPASTEQKVAAVVTACCSKISGHVTDA